jgi:predicted nucleotidyltransferase component of viral defense system
MELLPFEMRNPRFAGSGNIVTYTLEELIDTKIRALYPRKKGRDLFDVYQALDDGKLDVSKTMFYRVDKDMSLQHHDVVNRQVVVCLP